MSQRLPMNVAYLTLSSPEPQLMPWKRSREDSVAGSRHAAHGFDFKGYLLYSKPVKGIQ